MDFGALDGINEVLRETFGGLQDTASGLGLRILQFTLIVQLLIIVAESAISVARGYGGVDSALEGFLRAIVSTSIFAALIRAPEMILNFITGFSSMGSGLDVAAISPSGIIQTGVHTAGQLLEAAGLWNVTFLPGLIAVLIVGGFVAMAVAVMQALVESYAVGTAAMVMLGFGGASLTRDMAIGVLRQILGIAVKLLLTCIVLAGTVAFANALGAALAEYNITNALYVLGGVAFAAVVVQVIPNIAYGAISGNGAVTGIGSMRGATAMLSSAMSGLGSAAIKTMGAVNLAQQSMGAARLAGAAQLSGSGNGEGGGKFAASSAGIAARAIAHSATSRLDGTGPRHGSRLWNAAANVSRANQMTRQDNERQVEHRQKQVQEKREGAADTSRKQVAQSVRGMQQEKRDQAYAQKRIGGGGSANQAMNQRQEQQRKERDAMRTQETSRREQAAKDSRKRTADGVRASQQEKRDQVQQDRVTQKRQVGRSSGDRNDYARGPDRREPR